MDSLFHIASHVLTNLLARSANNTISLTPTKNVYSVQRKYPTVLTAIPAHSVNNASLAFIFPKIVLSASSAQTVYSIASSALLGVSAPNAQAMQVSSKTIRPVISAVK